MVQVGDKKNTATNYDWSSYLSFGHYNKVDSNSIYSVPPYLNVNSKSPNSIYTSKPSDNMDTISISKPSNKNSTIKLEIPQKDSKNIANLTGLSSKFIDKLVSYEGVLNKAYSDQGGIKTIGIGHNISADPNYSYGDTITDEQVYKLFVSDINNAKKQVEASVHPAKLSEKQMEALLDLFFNVGPTKLKNSNIVAYAKQGRFNEAACEMTQVHAKGNVVPGLCQRRIVDIDNFCQGKHTHRSLNLIKGFYEKGLVGFNKKIASSTGDKKKFVMKQRDVFIEDSTGIIDNGEKYLRQSKAHK